MKVGVVGLGRVGLPLALVMTKHFEVKGVDSNPDIIRKTKIHEHFYEENVNEYLEKYGGRLLVSTDFKDLSDCNFVFVVVQTPSAEDGSFSLKYIRSAIKNSAPYLAKDSILVIVSTINPTDIESEILVLLRGIGILKKIKGVCYSPTMIALGKAICGFEQPDYILIGSDKPEIRDEVENLWSKVTTNNPKFFKGNFTDIEVAKFAVNIGLTIKISYINTVTELCEKVGGDIDFISQILQADSRISGKRLLNGGLGYGGPCLPRDTRAFKASAEKHGSKYFLCDACEKVNMHQISRSVQQIMDFRKERVCILGLTYKPNTRFIEESQAVAIAKILSKNCKVMVYDPASIVNARKELKNMKFAESLKECLGFGEIIFIAVPWKQFQKLEPEDFQEGQIVIDPWRILRYKKLPCKYIPYGLKARSEMT